jgi:hypothetical protein
MTQEALKLALEALMRSRNAVSGDLDLAGCAYGKNDPDGHRYSNAKKALVTLDKAIIAIKEALAQPEQEPVAWRRREVGGGWQYFGWQETYMTYQAVEIGNENGFECEAIFATPPQRTWVDLTQQELDELDEQSPSLHDFVQNLMSKLKEKNNA